MMRMFQFLVLVPLAVGADVWTAMSTTGSKPSVRYYHTAILDGSDMVVFGGTLNGYSGSRVNDAYKLDLQTNTWTAISTTGSRPIGRSSHTAVLDGSDMVVFGGYGGSHSDGSFSNNAYVLALPKPNGASCSANHTCSTAFVPSTSRCVCVWRSVGF